MKIDLMHGDCLELMKQIPDNSIDFILTDPPYGTTNCKWDSVVDFGLMWKELKRIRKDTTAIALFGSEPFSSSLRISNIKEFKYDWVWQKNKPTNFLNAKKQPLRKLENISIFYKKQCVYNPQMIRKKPENVRKTSNGKVNNFQSNDSIFNKLNQDSYIRSVPDDVGYPVNILKFNGSNTGKKDSTFHPTQKPTELLEYLIKTYTNEGDTVLDFTMGSGSTGVACVSTNRNFIGIEMDDKYFGIANDRIKNKQL